MIVYLSAHPDGRVLVHPGQFLGPKDFKAYRDACAAGGAQYNASLKANLVAIEHAPQLGERLRSAGFAVKVEAGVRDQALRVADQLEAAGEQARGAVRRHDLLFDFQKEGAIWLAPRSSAILGDEMGLGKTPQALLAGPPGWRYLITCPASLMGMWGGSAGKPGAVERWRPDLRPTILESFRWPEPGEAAIINFERLPMTPDELEAGAVVKGNSTALESFTSSIPPDLILLADECHGFKNTKAKRTRRFRALSRAVRRAGGKTWGLTGTPMPNRPTDLLGVLGAFDLLKDSFGSFPRFIEMMSGRRDYWGNYTWGEPKPGAADALRRVMLRRMRRDVMAQLPDAIYEDIPVPLAALGREVAQADAEARLFLDQVSDEDLAAGVIPPNESVFRARRLLAEALIPKAAEIVQDYIEQAEPLIVFSAHREPIKDLGAQKGVAVIDADVPAERREAVALEFQAGLHAVLAATIKTAATGFTLTRAAHLLMIDEEWSPDWNDQAVARALRHGQTRGVVVKRLTVPGTAFERVRAINDAKRRNIAGSVDRAAVKSVIDSRPADLRRMATWA